MKLTKKRRKAIVNLQRAAAQLLRAGMPVASMYVDQVCCEIMDTNRFHQQDSLADIGMKCSVTGCCGNRERAK